MKFKEKNVSQKSKKSTISIILYVAASVIALLGVILLIDNILLFKDTIAQYTAKGYPADTVLKKLVPSQLLPQIFEIIAMYGGIAFVLLGVGIINNKVSKCLVSLTKSEVSGDSIEETVLKNKVDDVENMKVINEEEIVQDTKNLN